MQRNPTVIESIFPVLLLTKVIICLFVYFLNFEMKKANKFYRNNESQVLLKRFHFVKSQIMDAL